MKENVVFWNVDTQYDFIRANGKLPVPDAESIESNLERLTKLAKLTGLRVVNTADWHTEDSEEISSEPDFQITFPEHCVMGTQGAVFVPATEPENPYIIDWRRNSIDEEKIAAARNLVLYKDKFDIFEGNPHAERVLELIEPTRAIVYGVATNVCVDYAVMGLLVRGIDVQVVTDAIQGLEGLPDPTEKWKEAGVTFTTTVQQTGAMKIRDNPYVCDAIKHLDENLGYESHLMKNYGRLTFDQGTEKVARDQKKMRSIETQTDYAARGIIECEIGYDTLRDILMYARDNPDTEIPKPEISMSDVLPARSDYFTAWSEVLKGIVKSREEYLREEFEE